jgi:hypothetical protein
MATKDEMNEAIERLVRAHYYDEDFQLLSSFQAYASGLSGGEHDDLAELAFERLVRDGSLVDIILCSVVDVPSAVPVLAEKLSRETQTNQITRTLIAVLGRYATDDAYVAIEPFLDSDQEMEALQALARIDFVRTLPSIVRRMKKDHYAGAVLQMLHERIKKAGLPKLIDDLRSSSATQSAGFSGLLEKTLRAKDAAYNPLSAAEIEALAAAFR